MSKLESFPAESPAFSRESNSPKLHNNGRKKYKSLQHHHHQQQQQEQRPPRGGGRPVVVCRMGVSSSRGPLSSIQSSESNTPSRSESLTPVSSVNDLSSSMHSHVRGMRRSLEAEMMDRLLRLAHDDERFDLSSSSSTAAAASRSNNNNGTCDINNDNSNNDDGDNRQQDKRNNASKNKKVIPDKSYWKEKKFIQRYLNELNSEREQLKETWKAEFLEEEEEERRRRRQNSSERDGNSGSSLPSSSPVRESVRSMVFGCFGSMVDYLSYAEVFLSNMPLTIGAVGLSWVTQGTVWFKCMEEFVDSCIPTHYFDPHCVYYEFPSCFACDTTNSVYRTALGFHLICHTVAAICCLLFFGKLMLAWKLVADELSNPTTATPMGVVCITVICVLAGRFGSFGKYGVVSVSIFHVLLSFWFLYIAVFRFRLWPDPSWFPCTVGIAYASIKSWLYYPVFGWTLLILCVTYLFGTFFLAIYRAYTNMKISAPVCFISLSAPSITMYAMTTMAQPSPEREAILEASPELTTRWDEIHRNSFIPAMHFMMFLSMLGFASSLHSLARRWDEFKLKPFSPAHAAFVFPVLSHTNAIQSYRRVVIGFALHHSPYHTVITAYWILCLVGGTLLNFIFTTKYANRLPKWTNFDQKLAEDVEGDDESLQVSPPDPDDTIVHELWADTTAHEALREKFSNPAVLQANEAGILVRRRRGTEDYYQKGPYARSRNVPSIGFDPTLSLEELRKERAELLDWVVKNNPRQRHKTMSIPAIGGYGTFGLLGGESGDTNTLDGVQTSHRRSRTDLV